MPKLGNLSQETATKAERMIAGGLYSFVSKVGARVASIVNSIVIVRTLGFYDLGVLSVVLLLVAVGNIAASFGLPQAIVKFLSALPADRSEDAGRFIGGGLVLTLVTASLTGAALIAASPILSVAVYGEPLVAVLLPVAVLGLVVSAGLSPVLATIQAYERIRELGLKEILASILSVPMTVGLVLTFGLLGAILASVANSIIGIVVRVTLVRSIWRSYGLHVIIPRDRGVYRNLINYSLPAMMAGLLVTPAQLLASTLLTLNASFAELGLYAVGLSLATYLFFIPDSIGLPFVPLISRLTRDSPTDVPAFLLHTLRIATFLLLPPTLCIVLFPEWILGVIFGPRGAEAAAVAGPLAAGAFFAGVAGIVGHAISGIGRTWDGLAMNSIWALVFLSLSFLLVPRWKEVGLAGALLAAYTTHYAIALGYASKRWSIGIGEFAPSSLVAAVFLALSFAVSEFAPAPNSAFGVATVAVLIAVEFSLMSGREREVLTSPFRRLFRWRDWSS